MNNLNQYNEYCQRYTRIDGREIAMPITYADIKERLGDEIYSVDFVKLAKLREELEQYKKDNQGKFFVPNGTAEKFINAYAGQEFNGINIYFNLYVGGNDTQKTTAAVNSFINMLLPEPINPWFDGTFYKSFRRPCRARIVSDPSTVKDKIVPELEKWLPKNSYTATKGRRDYLSEWTIHGTGSKFDIMTYDQDLKEFESADIDIQWFDEPPKREIVSASIQRFRSGGYFMFTLTPLMGASFMIDEYINAVDDYTKVTTARMEDNCLSHGVRGIRSHEAILQKISKCDPLEIEARVEGKFVFLAGMKYPMFSKDIHIVDTIKYEKEEINNRYIIVNIIDPHDRKGFVMGWYLVELSKPYRAVAIKEYPEYPFEKIRTCSKTIREYVGIIKDIESQIGKPYLRWGDPNYGEKQVIRADSKDSLFEEIYRISNEMGYPIDYKGVQDDLTIGHKAVQERLRWEKDLSTGEMVINPTLFIKKGLYNHLYALTHYRDSDIDPITGKEKIDPDGKDFADLMRYFSVSGSWLYNPQLVGRQLEYQSRER